jgi:L-threonylcarbamoyladenylate synthase
MSALPIASHLEETLMRAAACLRDGGLVAFPTDTLYALGALAGDTEAVSRLFQAKNRPLDRPLPLLLASEREVDGIAESVPTVARRLMKSLWPGAVTLVLRRASGYRSRALGEADTVALRVPAHPVALELIRRAGRALTGTSANVSGGPDPRDADEVRRQLGGAVDFIVDAGPAPGGLESTIVDLSRGTPRLLREGAVSRAVIEEIVGPLESPQ